MYIRNRCPVKILNNKTPFKLWSEEKPYVGYFRIIGSKIIALNKNNKHGKFDTKSDEYISVSYSNESKAYRLWRPGTETVIKARDIRFIEKLNSTDNQSEDVFCPILMEKHTESTSEDLTKESDEDKEELNGK
jgi:hypothetical protein